MRRILSLALAATLLAALPACAGTGGEQKRVDLSAFAKTLQEKVRVCRLPQRDVPGIRVF